MLIANRKCFLVILFIFVTTLGCSKKDPVPIVTCELTSINSLTGSISNEMEISYNPLSRVYFITQTENGVPYQTFVYDYRSQGKVASAAIDGETYNWYYTDNQLDSIVYQNNFADDPSISYYNISFGYTGHLITSYYYSFQYYYSNSSPGFQKGTFTYQNGNVTMAITQAGDIGSTLVTSDTLYYPLYDSKTNPYSLTAKAIGSSAPFLGFPFDPTTLSKNNVLKKVTGSVTDVFTYEYTSDGYPTKVIDTQSGGTSPSVTTTTYTYSSCAQ